MSTRSYCTRIPEASPHNRMEYVAAYLMRWGGDARNALSCWRVDCLDNLKRDLSRPFPSNSELARMGLVERLKEGTK